MRPEMLFLAGVLVFALASMGVFRATAAGAADGDRTGRGGSFVLGFWVRNWFYWLIRPITRVSVAMGLTPLFYNLVAVMCGLASGVAYATGHFPLAGWLVFLSGLADVFDGEVARATHTADARGAFLDSTLDRFSEFFAFVGLGYYFASGWQTLAIVTALGGSLLVSYTRARGESLGVLCKVGVMQRAERMLLLGMASILDPWLSHELGHDLGSVVSLAVALVAVGTLWTSVHRTFWIARALRGR
ncbi:MAG TPA: CDP-alcohol phosphatidyltransferase family protein [Candidatus Krumholzibacteria bacterium]|nr:CDP-alcohol phosphatidyltransferase family protein [Candidatus Krumholzibacteria bacterium]